MKTDSIFYQLFNAFPSLLFELLGLDPALAQTYQFSSREVKQLAFRFDGLFLPTQAHQLIYFVEVQFQPDPELYYRLLAEIHLYLKQYQPKQAWRAVVIYPRKSMDPGLSEDLKGLESQIQKIYLNKLSFSGSIVMGIVDLIMATPKKAERKSRELIEKREGMSKELVELIITVMVYKFADKNREEIEAMFGLNELKQTRVYQEAQQEGIQLGKQEGIQIEAAHFSLRLLRRKLGPLPLEIEKRIQALPVEDLENLGEALLNFTLQENLTTWLDRRSE